MMYLIGMLKSYGMPIILPYLPDVLNCSNRVTWLLMQLCLGILLVHSQRFPFCSVYEAML